MPLFTLEEKELLKNYVTSTESDVFAVKNLQGIVGAVYARYSRAKGTFRETLLKEFIKEGVIDPKHAQDLIARILIAYGDDSVGELEGTHVSFERISMLATKEIEDRRIGGSPIEQSTRYVFYDQRTPPQTTSGASRYPLETKRSPAKFSTGEFRPQRGGDTTAGQWMYYRGKELADASFGKTYVETMDFIFETYARLVEPLRDYFKKLKPIGEAEYDINGDGVKEKLADLKEERDIKAFNTTYGFDVRSKACDTLRHLLPLSTLTNVGMFGNGRFFQGLISHLYTTDIPEAQKIGQETFAATSDVIGPYVKRAARSEYIVSVRNAMFDLAREMDLAISPSTRGRERGGVNSPLISLLPQTATPQDRDIQTIAAMLYPYADVSFTELVDRVLRMNDAERQRIIETYIGNRKTRRDRPGRALEHGYTHTFDLVTDWGVYKDLMRHRMNTQQRQLFTTRIGFFLAPEIVEAGFEKDVLQCVEKSKELYEIMRKENPLLAQYAVLHGNFVRWMLGMNDREAMHLIELRTTPQGHPNYRKVCQEMHRLIAVRSPWCGKAMQFADYGDYYWSRADSEARQRVKERKFEERGVKK